MVPSSLWGRLGFVPRLVSDPKVTILRTRIFQSLIFLLSLQACFWELDPLALEDTRRNMAQGEADGAGAGKESGSHDLTSGETSWMVTHLAGPNAPNLGLIS